MISKGFITLEYVLLFASVLSVLAVTATGIIALYNRNIDAIEKERLTDFCKELKTNVELLEIMPEGNLEIETKNLKTWGINKKNSKIIEIIAGKKKCEIYTTLIINLKNKNLEKNHKLILKKQNNTLNIN